MSNYLAGLAKERPKAFARLALDLEVLGAEGLRSQQITVRPLGDKLWELKRLYDGIQYRLFLGIWKEAVWLVHGIEKKSPKTPKNDLALARKRLREVMAR
ncbi:MAG: type II toxin-antitoxin system RelE/ParE family toxin [Candidatus Omnitrophica bacterium]|nr:type II toxin-antitoxin system RelE/ParE family toxin [Candidatus Omnitrophota bacterium]